MKRRFPQARRPRAVLAVIAGLAAIAVAVVACTANAPAIEASSSADVAVRKEVQELTAEEKADFVAAIKTLKELPPPDTEPAPDGSPVTNWYDWFVAVHLGTIMCNPDVFDTTGGYAHLGPTLLTWHRAFLAEFEEALSIAAGKTITIPYWDWTDPDSTAVVFSEDFMGPGGTAENDYAVTEGPFSKDEWTVTVKGFTSTNPGQFDYLVRALGTVDSASDLPTTEEVTQALLRNEYDSEPYTPAADADTSFRQYLDGGDGSGYTCGDNNVTTAVDVDLDTVRLHGGVHVWVGGQTEDGDSGSMKDCTTSPNDPIFWLHHANIDRIAEAWWSTHDYEYLPVSGGRDGDNIDDPVFHFTEYTNGDLASPTTEFGYVYSTLPTVSGEDEFQALPATSGEILVGHH